jgi:hypothetical protein
MGQERGSHVPPPHDMLQEVKLKDIDNVDRIWEYDLTEDLQECHGYKGRPLVLHTHERGNLMRMTHDCRHHTGDNKGNNVTPELQLVKMHDGQVIPYIVYSTNK